MKSYSEMILLPTLKERFEYLKLNGMVGSSTFGFDRYMNQKFYNSPEWKRFRRDIIIRDHACELGLEPYDISGPITIHHIEPITPEMILSRDFSLMDPDNVVCVSADLHRAIHYGDEYLIPKDSVPVRMPGDTKLW